MKPPKAILSSIIAVVVAALVVVAVSGGSVERAGLAAVIWCVIAAFAVNWIVFVPSWLQQTEKFFDLTGSLTYISCTLLAVALAADRSFTSWLVTALILIWAGRLGSFLFRRISKDGKDGRFDKIKRDPYRLFMTWTLQGLWVSLTAIAAWTTITATDQADFSVVTVVGLVVWIAGFGIEVTADRQKSAFRADPVNAGRFIDTGLWAWSRHPNYFGEITLWTGIAIIAIPSLDGLEFVALISPVFVTVLLTRISGIPLLARRGLKKWGDDPDYQRYLANTSLLIPRPPRS